MIRITQSYLINQTITNFINDGWLLIYSDIPGGRRSGVGMMGNINGIWEGLYNLSPDIVFENNGKILLIEVDSKLNQEYLEKFNKYISKYEELKVKLENTIGKKIICINFGFVSKTNKYKVIINKNLINFNFIYFNNGSMIKNIVNAC